MSMSYTEFTSKDVVTRTPHQCEWCGDDILCPAPAHYRSYLFDGDFVSAWTHPECWSAMDEADHRDLAEGWEFGEYKRGSTEPR